MTIVFLFAYNLAKQNSTVIRKDLKGENTMKHTAIFLFAFYFLLGFSTHASAAEGIKSSSDKSVGTVIADNAKEVKTELGKTAEATKDAVVRDAKAMKEDIPKGLKEAKDSAIQQSKDIKEGAAKELKEIRDNMANPSLKPKTEGK